MLKRIVTIAAISLSSGFLTAGAAYLATIGSMASVLTTLEDQVSRDRMMAIAGVMGIQTGAVAGFVAGTAAGMAAASGRRRLKAQAPLDPNQVLLQLLSDKKMPEGMTGSEVLSTIEAIALAQVSERLQPSAQPTPDATTDQKTRVKA